MFIYKNPGLKKYIRFKLHGWGVQTMEALIKKDREMRETFKVQTDKLIE